MKQTIKANIAVNSTRPNVGDLIVVRDLMCKVTKVYPFGTLDASAIEENQAFRVTGLAFL